LANIVPSLTLGLLPGLGQDPAIADGFRSWLLTGAYQPKVSTTSPVVVLEITDTAKLIRHVAFDYERFSLSSMESFAVAYSERVGHNLAGWPLLKLYYSAFFASHAIMRSQGSGVVKIEKSQAQYLNSILSILYPEFTMVSPGMYLYNTVTSKDTGLFTVRLEATPKDSGGVHEGFWRHFCNFLQDAAIDAGQKGAANATEFVAGVDEICGAIRNDGANSGIWFSSIRNEINYQHKYDVWFPVRRNGRALVALDRNKMAFPNVLQSGVSRENDPVAVFANLSKYLACLSSELAHFVANRSTQGRSFGQKWRRIVEQLK